MIPTSRARVPGHTDSHINREINDAIKRRVVRFADLGPRAIEQQLKHLDREWDVERALEANAATAMTVGLVLSRLHSPRWLFFSAAVAGFLLQHAIQGWCPPLPVLRRMGFRTCEEIQEERYALKVLRGDFEEINRKDPSQIYRAVTLNSPGV